MPTVIALPDILGWTSVSFDPIVPRATDRMEGRRTEAQLSRTSWWTGTWSAPFLEEIDMGKMDAFMMMAGDSGEVFRAYDAFRPRPIAWAIAHGNTPLAGTRAGGGAFDGTATLDTITNSRQVFVTGLPSNFQFRAGDYVEFAMSATLISLHRLIEDAQAGPDGTVTLKFRYGLDTEHFNPAATVNFEKPSCLMQIDPGSYRGPKAWSARNPSFSAQEVFFS